MGGNIVLRVQVIQGKGLAPKDSNGLSDPYVTIRINSKKESTKVIYKTLNPTWNEVLDFPLKEELFPQVLNIVCWDADFMTRDFMGQITVHAKDLFDQRTGLPIVFQEGGNNQWHRLQKKTHKDVITGEIELNIGFIEMDKPVEYWHRQYRSFGGRLSPPPEPLDD